MSRFLDDLVLAPVARAMAVGAAALLIAVGAPGCSSEGVSAQTGDAPAAEEQQEAAPAEADRTPEAGSDVSGMSWIEIIGEEQRDDDGVLLTTQELAGYIGVEPSEIAVNSPTPFITCMEEWSDFNDLDTAGNDLIEYEGQEAPFLTTGFRAENGVYISMMIGISPNSGNFVLRLSAPAETDNFYLFEDDEIPSTDILATIVDENVL
ncbi:hypothetical protein [Enorma burkinafasonensis]|uniref:hypothetical protein n=1 Tax=Enorma burkinafasonensis TaxID=2590867 RepID=UPI00119F7B5C|nr:hypothetical protein [Enorma burkinafasonensis]